MVFLPAVQALTVDYPLTHNTFQRDNATEGTLYFKGTTTSDTIDYSLNGIDWIPANVVKNGDEFTASFVLPVGAYNITLKDGLNDAVAVEDVRVGDVFVIVGQSNAVGGLWDPYYYEGNILYDVWTYHPDNEVWQIPTHYRYWNYVFNNLTESQNIPIGYTNVALGGVSITTWLPGGENYPRYVNTVYNMTGGTNRIAGVLMYQGEADLRNSEEENKQYYSDFANITVDLFDANFEGIIMAQIGENGPNWESRVYRARKPQSELWVENEFVHRGTVMHDVDATDDIVHYRYENGIELGRRWIYVINSHLYGGKSSEGPKIVLAVILPQRNIVKVTYDKDIFIQDWTGIMGNKAYGWKFTNGVINYTDDDILFTSLLDSKNLNIVLPGAIDKTWQMTYGTGYSTNNQTVVRDSRGLPSDIVYDIELTQQQGISFVKGLSIEEKHNSCINCIYS